MSPQESTINYNIWNATTSYRLLKGNNLEIKISALDILRQNTSIINHNRDGVITLGMSKCFTTIFYGWYFLLPKKIWKIILSCPKIALH